MSGSQTGPDAAPELRALAVSTERLFEALSGLDSEQLTLRPAPDAWSVWDIAYHVAQIEVWYLAKLCEAVSTGTPAALERFLEVWQQVRRHGLTLADEIPSDRLDRPGLLTGVAGWTPRDLLVRMAAHDEEHTEQATVAARSPRPPVQ
jgi:uncharacterized damage-inducible protein DinB